MMVVMVARLVAVLIQVMIAVVKPCWCGVGGGCVCWGLDALGQLNLKDRPGIASAMVVNSQVRQTSSAKIEDAKFTSLQVGTDPHSQTQTQTETPRAQRDKLIPASF